VSRPAYQPDESSAGLGFAAMAGLLALIPIGAAVAALMFWAFARSYHPPAATPLPAPRVAGPRLEAHPRTDRQALEGPERAQLESYGWSDRAAGLAHVPIERAMAMQAAQGWPDAEAEPAK
jgi:hypothetical protein